MKDGDFVAFWLSSGRLVTRWKNARSSVGNAIIAKSRAELEVVLQEKLGKVQSESVGIFQFVGLPKMSQASGEVVLRNARPIAASAMIFSKQELRAELEAILKRLDQDDSDTSFWAEIFVRHKTRKDEDDGGESPPRHRGPFRRD